MCTGSGYRKRMDIYHFGRGYPVYYFTYSMLFFQDFIQHRLPKGFEREHLTMELNHFIHSCIVVARKMVDHTPPIWIHWQPKGDEINREMFDCEGKTGSAVDWTVWPALLDETGAILSKGKIIPII